MLPRRSLLTLVFALALAAPAAAQTQNPRVVINTPEGSITLELFADKAPITTANFLKYVDRKLYDGATFYRASKPKGQTSNDYGSIQGGLQNDPKKVLPPIAHESTAKTGLRHTDGTISMGRHAPGSAQADWFIVIGDMPYLDASAVDPGFAAFGRVVDGMPVAKTILGLPTDPNAGVGAMKGEMLQKPLRITSIRRAPPAPAASSPPAPAPAASTP
ncbi:peptidylprolyl isomerase [Phenylobacterium sp.]|jgi:peptidyl-prolyl cis-trans isomerase A (cyclophilin A)|uniref:peptidylprolyl isomerase n=1 Tax=Phenylobacterium sp. TaxID=1871053 RepID=UPI002F4129FC